ncbi:MAG TPA: potassium-transporting ATPase subunit KdpA [Bacteroidales bacterium]|nr:potassium-transporting ATPase subunit KdpA [Bacteroidales bacterium]
MNNVIELIVFFMALILLSPIFGRYMFKVFTGDHHFMKRILGRVENFSYRFLGIDKKVEMGWKEYLFSVLLFNAAGLTFLFLIQILQKFLPLNPANLTNVPWHLAFNTSVSFTTNTNWQSYGGEITISYLVQMLGVTVQNFVSAATGIAVLLALMRGLTSKTEGNLGNFWVDINRTVLYVLLPLSMILTVLLVGQGVIQNFSGYAEARTLEGASQVIPMGPAASQIAIKQIGTNGGGFFSTNSAHPFENPTPFSNFLELFSIIIVSASLVFTYAHYMKSKRQAWTIFIVMLLLFSVGVAISLRAEYAFNHAMNVAGSMEGKETRFGIFNSILWSVTTTATSNGSVNSMHDSISPVSGLVAIFNIMLGEVIFGGVGSGLYGMIIFILLTVFIAGLMVGRTPEYLGKKIEAFEMKMAILAVLAPNIVIKLFSAIAVTVKPGIAGLNNAGPHGLSEILYAFSSAAGNNGSAFAGLNTNTVFYNLMLAFGMLIGRYGIIVPVLAIAGSMTKKKITPVSTGTFRTDNWLFAALLIGIILIVGGLTFFPPLALGPIAEHLLMNSGVTF